jgi:hypothetical protein
MLLTTLYTEALRYLYVLSTPPVSVAIIRGALAALVGTLVFAAWRLRAGARAARPATPGLFTGERMTNQATVRTTGAGCEPPDIITTAEGNTSTTSLPLALTQAEAAGALVPGAKGLVLAPSSASARRP